MIDTLRQQRRSWSPVDREAKEGDMVLFELAEKDKDEGARERAGTIIGSNAVGKELEDKLTGHKTGDEFDVDMTFPADFRIPALAGTSGQCRDQDRARAGIETCRKSTTRSSPASASATAVSTSSAATCAPISSANSRTCSLRA